MTDHPCRGIGWTRIAAAAVEAYVRGLPYQARRASRFGVSRSPRCALYRSESTGAHYRADFVDAVVESHPPSLTARELEADGSRGPVSVLELSWSSLAGRNGRVRLHEVSLL